ncbi:MAG: class I SAM-dependent methyltransferase [Desulfobacterales bacterium]|nr:class I SAM-dependent methyltransferase [Desulfobacterales bacterium]
MKSELNIDLIDKIKGFLDPEEGQCLYDMARKASKRGPCLEIGSYCGKSTVYIGTACRENSAILFSIDHHRGSEEQQPGEAYFDPELFDHNTDRVNTFEFFRKTIEMAGLDETVVAMVCQSAVAARMWNTPLSLVFIDGGHSYDAALGDYQAWMPHLKPGGYLLIHDIFEDPAEGGLAPYKVYSLALASGRFREIARMKTLGVLKKAEG